MGSPSDSVALTPTKRPRGMQGWVRLVGWRPTDQWLLQHSETGASLVLFSFIIQYISVAHMETDKSHLHAAPCDKKSRIQAWRRMLIWRRICRRRKERRVAGYLIAQIRTFHGFLFPAFLVIQQAVEPVPSHAERRHFASVWNRTSLYPLFTIPQFIIRQRHLRTATESLLRTVCGCEFQTAGAEHQKARFANVVVVKILNNYCNLFLLCSRQSTNVLYSR